MKPTAPAPGFVGSLRQLGDGLIATVQDRVRLISLELQEEKVQLLRVHLWLSVALFTGLLAVTFASLTLLYLFRDRAPLAVLAALTGLYTLACTVMVLGLRRMLRGQPPPFSATLEELEKDRTCLRKET